MTYELLNFQQPKFLVMIYQYALDQPAKKSLDLSRQEHGHGHALRDP